MIDRLTDAATQSLADECAAAKREAEKWRELYRIDGGIIVALIAAGVLLLGLLVAAFVIACGSVSRANTARDAAEVQSQLYLDGWKQCKREADAAVDSPASIIDSPADSQSKSLSFSNGIEEIGYVDAAGKCHGKVPRKYCGRWRAYNDAYRSLLDPTRRIDR